MGKIENKLIKYHINIYAGTIVVYNPMMYICVNSQGLLPLDILMV